MHIAVVLSLAVATYAVPQCNDNVQLQVSTSVSNIIIPATVNASSIINLSGSDLQSLVAKLPTTNLTGTYTIAGRYCEPEVSAPSHSSTVQLLVHGVGYDRNYWSGEGLPGSSQQVNGTEYSWLDYASQQGYPTFSIDRICNGLSTHIEGSMCQLQLNMAIVHNVVGQLRAGVVGGTAFQHVILVGHSLGSLIGNLHAQQYPGDFDAMILTAFSDRVSVGVAGTVGAYAPLPASEVLPNKYSTLGADYFVSTSRQGFETAFYSGNYSEALVDLDFAMRGTLALGELVTAVLGQLPAPAYHGDVMVLTGQEDEVFCSTGPVSALLSVSGDCGSGSSSASAQVQLSYPSARTFSWYQTPDTGHCLHLHTTAETSFVVAHDFLNNLSF